MTKYEEKILNIIKASHNHMTSEEIFLKLKEEEPKVVLATVYNNLKKLSDNGEIVKLSIANQPDRYDRKEKHDHLICSVCGEITDFCFSDFTKELEEELGTAINGYDLKISYICPSCRKNG